MSGKAKYQSAELAALDRFMVEQILGASEDEILSQAEPGDVERADEAFRKARQAAGKSMMARAREAATASRTAAPAPFDAVRTRQRLNDLVRSQGAHAQRLTLAARGAKGDVDGDDEGILEDLNELLRDVEGNDPS